MVLFSLLSSLPMLKFEDVPPMSSDRFLEECKAFVDPERMKFLEALDGSGKDSGDFPKKSLAAKYTVWDGSLRNALAKQRAARAGVDPTEFLRPGFSFEPDAERAAAVAFNAENPLERERALDRARWEKIEEFENGKFFSHDLLYAYRLKLLILEKWNRRSAEKSAENLDRAADSVRNPANH